MGLSYACVPSLSSSSFFAISAMLRRYSEYAACARCPGPPQNEAISADPGPISVRARPHRCSTTSRTRCDRRRAQLSTPWGVSPYRRLLVRVQPDGLRHRRPPRHLRDSQRRIERSALFLERSDDVTGRGGNWRVRAVERVRSIDRVPHTAVSPLGWARWPRLRPAGSAATSWEGVVAATRNKKTSLA